MKNEGTMYECSVKVDTLDIIMDVYNGCTSWIEDDCPSLTLFLNLFFYFLPAAALCHDFSLVDSVKTLNAKSNSL